MTFGSLRASHTLRPCSLRESALPKIPLPQQRCIVICGWQEPRGVFLERCEREQEILLFASWRQPLIEYAGRVIGWLLETAFQGFSGDVFTFYTGTRHVFYACLSCSKHVFFFRLLCTKYLSCCYSHHQLKREVKFLARIVDNTYYFVRR